MTEFCQAAPISSIDSAIFLLRQAIRLRGPSDIGLWASVCRLADAILSRCFHTRQPEDLDEAVVMLRGYLHSPLLPHLYRSQLLAWLCAALVMRFILKGRGADLAEATHLHAQQVRPNQHIWDEEGFDLFQQGTAILEEFLSSGNVPDLDTAVMLLQEALDMVHVEHPKRHLILGNLANTLYIRYQQTGRDHDLQDSIALNEEVYRLIPVTHPDRSNSLNNLAAALSTRFEQKGQVDDLEASILYHREALTLRPAPHPEHSVSLNNLGTSLSTRFETIGQVDDIEEAILCHQKALTLRPAPHPHRSISLHNLAASLSERFKQKGQMDDLEDSILLSREALTLGGPAPHPDRSSLLNNLATMLETRFEQKGQMNDLEESISHHRAALTLFPAPHPRRPSSLNNLASALSTRFRQIGQVDDLEEATLYRREALRLCPASHSDHPAALTNLASVLLTRFDQQNRVEDLEEAVLLCRQSLTLCPAPHPHRYAILHNLANALLEQFGQKGQVDDLEEGIAHSREALMFQPAPDFDRSLTLNNLASALSSRFEQKGQVDDLEEAIVHHRKALTFQPAQHLNRFGTLNNLANALATRFKQKGQADDLEEAILHLREALTLRSAPHPDRAQALNNLANTLSRQFEQKGQVDDIEEAILHFREAVELCSTHTGRSLLSHNLAHALSTRYEQTGQVDDLEEAVLFQQAALVCLPASNPQRCRSRAALGFYLCQNSGSSDRSLLDTAMNAFRDAVTSEPGPLLERLQAAKQWAINADDAKHASALEAYQAAVQLLPQVAMLASDVKSRHRLLADQLSGALSSRAAACAIRLGEFEQAVEMLEEGRSVFWSYALRLRTSLEDLQLACPELAQELRENARTIEQGSFREGPITTRANMESVMSMETEAVQYRRQNEDWLSTLERVRALEGFEGFMRPKKLASLQRAAARGPVVLLNVTVSSCDVLIVTSTAVDHVPLDTNLTVRDVVILANSIVSVTRGFASFTSQFQAPLESLMTKAETSRELVLNAAQDRHFGRRQKAPLRDADDVFRAVLAILWTIVVRPVIRHLRLEVRLFYETPSRSIFIYSRRNLTRLRACGGAQPVHLLFSPYMQQAYMHLVQKWEPSRMHPITWCRPTRLR